MVNRLQHENRLPSAMLTAFAILRSQYLLIAIIACCSAWLPVENGFAKTQDSVEEDQWFSANVVIDDQKLDSLRRTGALNISLPPQYVNRVDAIVLKRPFYFKEENATEFLDITRDFRSVSMDITETLLDQLDYQAVELRIYESEFDTIVLRYVGGKVTRDAKTYLAGDAENDSPVVKVLLKNGKGISGRIRGMKKIHIDSVMGELDIDIKDVSLITFNKEDQKFSFAMRNGDNISGESEFKEIELLSRWGTEVLDLIDIRSIKPEQPLQTRSRRFTNQFPTNGIPGAPMTTRPALNYGN